MHFLTIANGSLRESETFTEIVERLEMPVDTARLRARAKEVGRLLSGLTRSLNPRV